MIKDLAACRCRLRLGIALEREWMDEALAVTGNLAEAFAALSETAKFHKLHRLEARDSRTFNTLLVNPALAPQIPK